MDLNFAYPLRLGPVTVNFLAAVFNLFNAQRPVLLDQRYNFAEFENAGYVCGSSATNPDEGKCNSRYKQAFQRQLPRSLRFGMRVSF